MDNRVNPKREECLKNILQNRMLSTYSVSGFKAIFKIYALFLVIKC